MNWSNPSVVRAWLPLACIAAALVGYALPSAIGTGAALTFNAYDLAEWVTLNPASNAETPPLFSAFLLRAPLMGIGIYAAAYAAQQRRSRWVYGLVWLALTAGLVPPFEFIDYLGNPNYRQQAALSLLTLIIGGVLFVPFIRRVVSPRIVGIVAAIFGGVTVIGGVLRGLELMSVYGVALTMGAGAFVCAAGCFAAALSVWRGNK
ncbi:MAG: hypothetical protein SGI73_10420 [Chloroflexota bacterium]|nr:hypothetical protein [Chloroflexota bacterium]